MGDVQDKKTKITVNDIEEVILNIRNVDPAVRHAFNETCKMQCRDRGEKITQLMEQWVRSKWGDCNTADALIDGYRLWKLQELRDEAAKLDPPSRELDN